MHENHDQFLPHLSQQMRSFPAGISQPPIPATKPTRFRVNPCKIGP